MKTATKFGLSMAAGYVIFQLGRLIYRAPGWCALVIGLLLLMQLFGGGSFEMFFRGIHGFAAIFLVIAVIGLMYGGQVVAGITCLVVGFAVLALTDDLFLNNVWPRFPSEILPPVPNKSSEPTSSWMHWRPTNKQLICDAIGGVLGISILLGRTFLLPGWRERRDHKRARMAYELALTYDPDAALYPSPAKTSKTHTYDDEAPVTAAPYQPSQSPTQWYQPPPSPHQPQHAWIAEGRRAAGLEPT